MPTLQKSSSLFDDGRRRANQNHHPQVPVRLMRATDARAHAPPPRAPPRVALELPGGGRAVAAVAARLAKLADRARPPRRIDTCYLLQEEDTSMPTLQRRSKTDFVSSRSVNVGAAAPPRPASVAAAKGMSTSRPRRRRNPRPSPPRNVHVATAAPPVAAATECPRRGRGAAATRVRRRHGMSTSGPRRRDPPPQD